jgi:hypothetical protein
MKTREYIFHRLWERECVSYWRNHYVIIRRITFSTYFRFSHTAEKFKHIYTGLLSHKVANTSMTHPGSRSTRALMTKMPIAGSNVLRDYCLMFCLKNRLFRNYPYCHIKHLINIIWAENNNTEAIPNDHVETGGWGVFLKTVLLSKSLYINRCSKPLHFS